jgi:hypothetical protein
MSQEEQDDLQGGPEEGGGYSGRYLHIANGKVVERTTADNPKAVKRTPKPKDDGTPRPDVYELIYDSFSGRIEAMFNRERTVPWQTHPLKSTVVVLKAGGELYNLELQHNGRYWPVFMNCLASGAVDLNRGVRIKAWDYKQKGTQKRMVGLGLYQKATAAQVEAASKPDAKFKLQDDGTVQIPWRWTKENPGKQPPPKVHKIPGKDDIWDFSERDEFLRGVVVFFEEKLKAMREAELNELEQAGATTATPEPAPKPTPVAQTAPVAAPVSQQGPPDFDPNDEGPPPFTDFGPPAGEDQDLPF